MKWSSQELSGKYGETTDVAVRVYAIGKWTEGQMKAHCCRILSLLFIVHTGCAAAISNVILQ